MWPFKDAPAETGFSAVLLIDMQEKFVRKLERGKKEQLVRAQSAVIRHCAAKDTPLIVLEYEKYGPTIEALRAEAGKVPGVTIITKSKDNGFLGTDLHRTLDAFGVQSFLVMGINASCCVFETAHDAITKGYRICTASDLIADSVSLHDYYPGWHPENWYSTNGVFLQDFRPFVSLASERKVA